MKYQRYRCTLLTIICLTFALYAFASVSPIKIDEAKILNLLQDSPKMQELKSMKEQGLLNLSLLQEIYNTSLNANFNYITNEEKQLNNFIPVTSPIKQFGLTVQRSTEYGVTFGLRSGFEQSSNNFLHHNSAAILGVQIGIDIYKELIGKVGRNKLKRAEIGKKVNELQSTIAIDTYKSTLRKLYWSLVANNESQLLMKNLISFSEKQVDEAVKRLANNIADRGEVARYRSQLVSRKASLLSLEFRNRMLLRSLREFLPQFENSEIELSAYNLDKTLGEVLSCTTYIAAQSSTPDQNSYYDDISKLLLEDSIVNSQIIDKHNSIDIKLQSEFRAIGKDFSYSNAFNNLTDEQRKGVQIGLTINIPLDSKKSTTEDIRHRVEEKSTIAQAKMQESQLNSMHVEVVRSLNLLGDVLKNQEENSKQLQISLNSSRKKFEQARLNVQQLVQEQDVLLQSDLDVINTKLTVVHTLLDYFSVFPLTPCPLNRNL